MLKLYGVLHDMTPNNGDLTSKKYINNRPFLRPRNCPSCLNYSIKLFGRTNPAGVLLKVLRLMFGHFSKVATEWMLIHEAVKEIP